ncbi:MAG: hypothetical protein PHI12_10435 [Dehalococcoidales bacterium]|nr:hypothetical protein [Dehalococcoidales bacterium]
MSVQSGTPANVFYIEVISPEIEKAVNQLNQEALPALLRVFHLETVRLKKEVREEIERQSLVDTGAMRDATESSVEEIRVGSIAEVVGRVFNDIAAQDARGGTGYYALSHHQGFRKWVPFAVSPRLLGWAIRHGFAVMQTRDRWGYRPPGMWVGSGKGAGRPFMRLVAERNALKVLQAVEQEFRALLGRITT